MKLKGRILTSMIATTIIIIMALTTVNYMFTFKSYQAEIDARRLLETELVSEQISKWIVEEKTNLDRIVDDMNYLEVFEKPEVAEPYLKRVVADNKFVIDYYASVEDKGEQYLISSYDNLKLRELSEEELKNREWYKEGKRTKDHYISKPYLDQQTKKVIITISRPFKTSKGIGGVFAADIMIEDLLMMIEKLDLGEGTEAFVVRENGDIIAHQNEKFKNQGEETLNIYDYYGTKLKRIMEGTDVGLRDREIKAVDEDAKYYYTSEIREAKWYFGTTTDSDIVNEGFKKTMTTTAIYTVVIVGLLLIVSSLIANTISKPIKNSAEILERIGNLDLTAEVPKEYLDRKDEIGDMSKTFNLLIDKLQLFMYGMREAIDVNNDVYVETIGNIQTLNRQSEENAATTEELSAGMEETTATTTNILSSVENIDDAIKNFSKMIDTIDDIAKKIYRESEHSNDEFTKSRDMTIEKYTVAKENIEEAIESARSVERIGILSESITKIAEQTTLLSLNAAIEAARAGESGKGFEVVAVEIRKLAEDSNEAANQIKEITSTIETSIGKLVYDTEDLIDLIEGTVMEDYNGFVDSSEGFKENGVTLDRAVDEIVKRSAGINDNIGNITRSIQEITMTMEESTKATVTIAEENMHMVESIHNISEQMDDSKESGDKLEALISEVKLDSEIEITADLDRDFQGE